VAFWRVARNNAALLASGVGTPLAWPANWLFAAEHGLPVEQYDAMVGKYLFYRQNNLAGVIDLGDERADPALLGEGWGPQRACGPDVCRELRGRARVFAPLDLPETLELVVRAAGQGSLHLEVNGDSIGELPLAPELAERRVRVPVGHWRRELNEIVLEGNAAVERLVFERPERGR
jgi:hypothetical protein